MKHRDMLEDSDLNSASYFGKNGMNLFARFKQAESQLSSVHTPPRKEQRGLTTRWGGREGRGRGEPLSDLFTNTTLLRWRSSPS